MRPVLCGLAAGVIACQAAAAQAQQGSVQISGAAQGVTGSAQRIAGENAVEPDFGVAWLQPGDRFGTFQVELRGTRRGDRLHVGRNYAALRDVKYRGLSWTFEAGDTYFTRALGEYGFSNLTTPAVTFGGGALSARSTNSSIHVIGGRTTAWRNIFGSDPDTLAQWVSMVRGSHRFNDRLEILGRASRIRTSGLREFAFSIADSKQAGGGMRFRLTPAVQLIGDGSFVQYRRLDSGVQQRDGSFVAGANFLLSRGWIQMNVSRFSPGEFPAMNDPLHDRETGFAAAEYDVWPRLRLFAGWEGIRTNIDPDVSNVHSRDIPRNIAARGFGGVRLQLGGRSTLTVRAEEGDRIAQPVRSGVDRESDTGLRSAEWQAAFGRVTAYTRLSRRLNIDNASTDASYTQDDVSGQLFMRLSASTQLFGLGAYTRHDTTSSIGSSYWQAGGGAQLQLMRRNLWFRGEGTASRSVDLLTREFVPRESFNVGVNGDLGRGTAFALNIAADHTPGIFGGTPWITRSTLRVTQTFSTGAARVPTFRGVTTAATRARGAATILGVVFADWNANGIHDPDETPLENIPVRVTGVSSVTTRRDGEFSFLNVPAGPQEVGLDTSAIPVDFDPPAESLVNVELDRGVTRRVSFGLIPLGAVRGRVVLDANRNGRVDAGEEPLEGAVLVLDRGARSEQVRRGAYRFDSIRSGDHVVSLVRESLPEGAVVTGAMEVPLALKRDQLAVEIDFAVAVEKRPETRKVFPPRGGAPQKPGAKPAASNAAAPQSTTAAAASQVPTSAPARGRATVAPAVTATPPSLGARASSASVGVAEGFAVQVAALLDPARAKAIVRELAAAGYPAYLLEPAADDPDGPYRVRIGRYRSRTAAAVAIAKLERSRGEKLWVIREAAAGPAGRGKPGTD